MALLSSVLLCNACDGEPAESRPVATPAASSPAAPDSAGAARAAPAPHPIDRAIETVRGGGDSVSQWAAVRALQDALQAGSRDLCARVDHPADDPELLAWQRGLSFLMSLAEAGWQVAPLQDAVAARRLAQDGAADRQPASDFEAWLTTFLLRRRLSGSAPALRELPLEQLADTTRLQRYARPDSEQALWTLVLIAMLQRGAGATQAALDALDVADTAMAGPTPPAWPTVAVYSQLERASCHQRLGRAAAASRALSAAHRISRDWQLGADESSRQLHRETSAVLDLARVRQNCLAGRTARAGKQITALRTRDPGPAITAQLDYYDSLVQRDAGDDQRARDLLRQALAQPRLAPRMRGLALLEAVSRLLTADSPPRTAAQFDEVRQRLTDYDELAAAQAGEDWPLLGARAAALRARITRFEVTAGDAAAADRQQRLEHALADARAAYHSFLAAWEAADDGLGIGTLAFQPRRLLVDEILELHLLTAPGLPGVERALEAGLRARARGALARSLDASAAPTLEAVRERLLTGSRRGLLLLLPGASHTHAFLVTTETVHHQRGAPLEDLREPIRAVWRELVAVPDASDLAASRARAEVAALQLHDALFTREGLRDRLAALDELLFVGGDLLERLPVEVLPLAGDRGLGLTHAVTVTPSTAVALRLAERRPPTPRPRLTALLPPAPGPATNGAPRRPVEFAAAARALVDASCATTSWFEGRQATIERMREPPGDALLLFGHGILDGSRPRPRGVALASSDSLPGGGLFPAELEAAGIQAPPLVLMAVCDATGTDAQPGGDDSDHLAASWLRAGARTVFASPCALEQGATAALTAATLRELGPECSAAEALRRARGELRRIARYDHPRFWGTWSAFGL